MENLSITLIASYSIQIFLALLAADLLAGLIHWSMDSYGSRETPLVGSEIQGNRKHHKEPKSFTKNSWWKNAKPILPIVLAIGAVLYAFDFINVFSVSFLIIGWNSSEIHKWAHQGRRERVWIGTLLQKLGAIQSPRQHQIHHSGLKDSHYCPVSPFMNPILDKMNFWRNLERVVFYITGLKTVPEVTVNNAAARPYH